MKKIRFSFLILFFGLIVLSNSAQNTEYVKQKVSDLASPTLFGRGYIKKGDQLAAQYLEAEVRKLGLSSLESGFTQEFSFPVNTYPSHMELIIDGKALIAGEDFIIKSNSPSIKGKYKIAWINQKVIEHEDALINMINNIDENYVIAIDTLGVRNEIAKELVNLILKDNPTKASAVLWVNHKGLTFRVFKRVDGFATFEIKAGVLNSEAKEIEIKVKNKLIKKHKANNVMAIYPGKVDTFICFTAHYDHLGGMGLTCYFPGANDNASGSALLLDFARDLQERRVKPHYSYLFIWFAAEEAGLLGSKHFTDHPPIKLDQIKTLFNFDMVGTGEDGITVVNAEKYPEIHQKLNALNLEHNLLKEVRKRGVSANSDHHYFSEKGVPAVFIYTMGSFKEYHNIYDQADQVPFSAYTSLFKLIRLYCESIEPHSNL
jgi:aminopeptidase YwaD